MKNILIAILLVLVLIFGLMYWNEQREDHKELKEQTALIQEQLRNVGKLVVTEGTYSQVYTYKNSKSFYLDIFSARKKALIIVNAEASLAYDLSKLEVDVDEKQKRLIIRKIPKEEISINPNIEFYDVTQDYLNQFEAEDYNEIKKRIEKGLREKIEKSKLKTNARNRLISELQKIYILTSSMGWSLEYQEQPIENAESLEQIKL